MDGKELDWSVTGKYLGVTLDRTLQWTSHIFEKLKKAKRQLFMYKLLVGQHFGPQPQYMRWMYMGIVRPSLSYGAVVWWHAANSEQILGILTQLSRIAMMTWSPMWRNTPTSGLEMLGYLPPMDLFLQREVVKAWIRINNIHKDIWDRVGTKQLGHHLKLSKLADAKALSVGHNSHFKKAGAIL
jgi:hypothetical protein